jgi:hypothetical protein
MPYFGGRDLAGGDCPDQEAKVDRQEVSIALRPPAVRSQFMSLRLCSTTAV